MVLRGWNTVRFANNGVTKFTKQTPQGRAYFYVTDVEVKVAGDDLEAMLQAKADRALAYVERNGQ